MYSLDSVGLTVRGEYSKDGFDDTERPLTDVASLRLMRWRWSVGGPDALCQDNGGRGKKHPTLVLFSGSTFAVAFYYSPGPSIKKRSIIIFFMTKTIFRNWLRMNKSWRAILKVTKGPCALYIHHDWCGTTFWCIFPLADDTQSRKGWEFISVQRSLVLSGHRCRQGYPRMSLGGYTLGCNIMCARHKHRFLNILKFNQMNRRYCGISAIEGVSALEESLESTFQVILTSSSSYKILFPHLLDAILSTFNSGHRRNGTYFCDNPTFAWT
jgi:hypothetical protein